MIKKLKTDCGLNILLEEMPHVRSVGTAFFTATGSINEDDSVSGISHAIEHMMFKGTSRRTPKEIAGDVDKIGGSMNAFTGKEMTCYHVKSIVDKFEDVCDVLSDMITDSKFDEDELEREKKVINEEISMIEDVPEDIGHDLLLCEVFRGTGFESPVIGTRDSVNSITRDSILKYLENQYAKDSMLISVVGNVDEKRVMNFFNGKFEKFAAKKKGLTGLEEVQPGNVAHLIKRKAIEQAHLFLGIRTPEIDNELQLPLRVVTNLFGGSMSSRLFQRIREEKGLAYSVYSSVSAYRRTGMFGIYAGVSNEKTERALQGIFDELKKIKSCGIDTDEINSAKMQLKSAYSFNSESPMGRMFYIGRSQLLRGFVPTEQEFFDSIDAITNEDLERAIDLICDPALYSAVGVVSENANLNFADVIA